MSDDSKRTQILEQVETTLHSLQSLKSVERKKVSPVDLEVTPFPAAFIFSGPENKLNDQRAVIGYENWLWRIIIEVWFKEINSEDLLKEIHDTMWENRRLGGYAETSERVGVDFFVVDVTQSIEAMIIYYDVLYRHQKGVM